MINTPVDDEPLPIVDAEYRMLPQSIVEACQIRLVQMAQQIKLLEISPTSLLGRRIEDVCESLRNLLLFHYEQVRVVKGRIQEMVDNGNLNNDTAKQVLTQCLVDGMTDAKVTALRMQKFVELNLPPTTTI